MFSATVFGVIGQGPSWPQVQLEYNVLPVGHCLLYDMVFIVINIMHIYVFCSCLELLTINFIYKHRKI